jgi:hypothetical protein
MTLNINKNRGTWLNHVPLNIVTEQYFTLHFQKKKKKKMVVRYPSERKALSKILHRRTGLVSLSFGG